MAINILHISDLHLEDFDDNIKSYFTEANFENKLIKKIKADAPKIDYVVITGDLSNSGKEKEYEKVKKFLEKLSKQLPVKKDNFLICPGNHDINWIKNKTAFRSYQLSCLNDGKQEPEESDAFKFHKEKFEDFIKFYNSFYDDPFITFNPEVALFRQIVMNEEKCLPINLCAINSCFMESFYENNHIGHIDHNSLEEELGKSNENTLKIFALHHIPISLNQTRSINNWESEIFFLCREHNARIFLFGHQHQSQTTKIIDSNSEYLEYSVGTLGKMVDGEKVENTFNLLEISQKDDNTINIKQRAYQYNAFEGKLDWRLVDGVGPEKKIVYCLNGKVEDLTKSLNIIQSGQNTKYSFPTTINEFSTRLIEIVKSNKLFSSGHFHWNKHTRTLGLIDTYTLLAKRESSLVAKGAIIEVFQVHNIECDYIIGLGQEGIVLGSALSAHTGIPFSTIPYHSRKNDYSKLELELPLTGYKKITLITDVICTATSISDLLEEKKDLLKDVEEINLLSLFYISKEQPYAPGIFKETVDNRISFYTVCDKIVIDKCRAVPKECPVYCNDLEKVHSFH